MHRHAACPGTATASRPPTVAPCHIVIQKWCFLGGVSAADEVFDAGFEFDIDDASGDVMSSNLGWDSLLRSVRCHQGFWSDP